MARAAAASMGELRLELTQHPAWLRQRTGDRHEEWRSDTSNHTDHAQRHVALHLRVLKLTASIRHQELLWPTGTPRHHVCLSSGHWRCAAANEQQRVGA